MALPQGINFRNTAGFVTDGTNEDYHIPSRGAYPWTTAQGNNVGYENGVNLTGRDRNAGNDRRIAGTGWVEDVSERPFRIDLPSAGNYRVGCAGGEANYATDCEIWLEDSGGLIQSLCTGTTSGANQFKDATNTEYSAANWPTSQTLVQITVDSAWVRFFMEHDGVGSQDFLTHAYIEEAVAAATPSLTRLTASPLRWR